MSSFPRKFLSLRDRNGAAHHRSKSAPPGNKNRPLRSDVFRSLFKADNNKNAPTKDGVEGSDLEQKLKEIQHRLDELGITNVTDDHIKDIMATRYAEWDTTKTVEFIDIEQKASTGTIIPYDRAVHMVGAENRGSVTCYLDSLLFSMFAKMDAFECILKNNFPADDRRNRLVNLLRIWVNMLRSGKLITTDLTKLIQDSLAECGWPDAGELEQQDTSEAFAFLTETLQLPLLSLQVDLFHHGKKDDDDHKVVYERLLNLAVPPDPEDKGIKLEDCLEEYFNAQVDVLRDSEELKKSTQDDKQHRNRTPTLVHRNTIRIMTEETQTQIPLTDSPVVMSSPSLPAPGTQENGQSVTMERLDPQTPSSSTSDAPPNDAATKDNTAGTTNRPSTRQRSTSVIQNVVIDESGRPSPAEPSDDATFLQRAKKKGSTVVKAVTIPAWQFFRLIPWHALSANEPKNDVEVAMNFDQRPVVGICLKRYVMTETGQPRRHNTYIDIPDSLRLPRFMLAEGSTDGEDDTPELDTDYKLVLQSVICHRGDSVQSGHYISFARVAPKLLVDNRRHDFDPPPDYEEAQWVRFDDLELDGRVQYVDNIKQALRDEMPYLLFYQIVPMVDAPSSESTAPEPPSYEDFKISVDLPSTPETPVAPQYNGNGFKLDEASTPTTTVFQSPPSKAPSIRFSSELERPDRKSLDAGMYSVPSSTQSGSRRQSMQLADSNVPTPARTPDAQNSPLMSPTDESTASRLSRAAARFRGRQSRPTSQSGENRIVSRVTSLMMRPSRDTLGEPFTMNLGSTTSTARSSFELASPALESPLEILEIEEQKSPLPSRSNSQKKGKNGKAKEKNSKDKAEKRKKDAAGDAPERECTVM